MDPNAGEAYTYFKDSIKPPGAYLSEMIFRVRAYSRGA